MKLALSLLALIPLLSTPLKSQGPPPPVLLGTGICMSNPGEFLAYGSGNAGDTVTFVGTGLPVLQYTRLIVGNVAGAFHIPFTSGLVCMDTNFMWGHEARLSWGSGWLGWGLINCGLPGVTWYFQYWYRLPYGGSGFSDAVEITFQ
jgi:hypothetical protein